MCLMLYLGTERPVVTTPVVGPLMLERLDHETAPTVLRDQATVYRIGSRLPHGGKSAAPPDPADGLSEPMVRGPGCACVFRETDESASLAAYDGLRRLLGDIVTGPRDSVALLGCWSGEERYAPAVEMAMSVGELSAEIELFSDVIHGWPILMRVTAPTSARRAVAAGDR